MQFLAVTVPCFLIALVFVPSNVPTDVGYLSIIIFGIVLLGLSFSPHVARTLFVGGSMLERPSYSICEGHDRPCRPSQ